MGTPTVLRLIRALPVFLTIAAFAETGHEAWLRYTPTPVPLPAVVTVLGDTEIAKSARAELVHGIRRMTGRIPRLEPRVPGKEPAIIAGTAAALRAAGFAAVTPSLKPGGFVISYQTVAGQRHLTITGADDRGMLYGAFALLRRINLRQDLPTREEPYAPVRWLNHWDNLDGTIERGYGGRSIFFEGNNVREDLSLVRDYARLLASLGINGCSINNVNANVRVITPEFLPQIQRIAAEFRPWGVQVVLSVDFSSPQRLGGLPTFDPLDPTVITWWQNKIDELYTAIPDLGGIVVKADSEGRLGPSAYGRSHADAANVIARPLRKHGGLLFYRGFVYNHRMDWRNLKNDRARAAYDNFINLDGKFEDNAVIQIKHGPIDFQVREPASPLFGALEKTSQAIELQITQEYFGQGRHHVFLVPMWKEALDFDLQAKGSAGTPVKALAAGKTFNRPTGGFIGVSNVGRNANWLGHDLSQANLYGFGRLAWNPDLTSSQIASEWTRLTFTQDPVAARTITTLLTSSWRTFENYTGPLGAQTLTDISGNHYGPAVESSERNGWGQWHRADEKGIGMDRTSATGTGYIAQYRPPVAKMYESLATCPDELLLFMHHVPYTHKLRGSGKTVIQHIYDTHYEGAAAAQAYVDQWKSVESKIDEPRYRAVLARLEYQAGHVEVWRDAINSWFLQTSGIADAKGRAGKYPGRYEAENLELDGYRVVAVKPFETASGSKAISCESASNECAATLRYPGKPGWHDLNVRYFDQNDGISKFRLYVNDQLLEEWQADNDIPSRRVDGHTSSRRLVKGVNLRTGDVIQIAATADKGERAPLDYIEIR
jgi:alpha-glucuronidase